jgi:predicted nucleotidyltransferase
MDPEQIECAVRDVLATDGRGIAAVYLFGSVARGSDRPGSDVDLAVLYRKPPAPTLAQLPLELEAALESRLDRPVQIVALHTAPVDLVHRVLRDGQLLVDADPSLRIRFEVRARNEYFDLEPILRRYRRIGEPAA